MGYGPEVDTDFRETLDSVLDRYYEVGVQDHYDASVELLARQFGWRLPGASVSENVGKGPRGKDLDPELVERIRHHNALDAAIHAVHRDRFDGGSERTQRVGMA